MLFTIMCIFGIGALVVAHIDNTALTYLFYIVCITFCAIFIQYIIKTFTFTFF